MLPPIKTRLETSAAVVAAVGTGSTGKIFRNGEAPQGLRDTAYITWFVVADTPENNLSDTPPTDRVTVQADIYHPTDAGCNALAKAVRDCIEPVAYMTGAPVNHRDRETRLYRRALQFDWWLDRD
jgi:uncharacterized protein DUF3168